MADCTDYQGLDDALSQGNVPAYRVDATASSLHVGSLIQIRMLLLAAKNRPQPITLMGGGTTKWEIRLSARMSVRVGPDQIDANIAGIRKVFAAYLDYQDDDVAAPNTGALMLNNAEWLDGLN